MSEKIRAYWERRAEESQGRPTATTNDVYLRVLEAKTLVDTIKNLGMPSGRTILDAGCGDGLTTIRMAKALPTHYFEGLDFSDSMLELAQRRLDESPELAERVRFHRGDVLRLEETSWEKEYEIVLTDRCLINLETQEDQATAVEQIARVVKGGAHYLAVENFIEGHDRMNEARKAMGLPEIPVRWHNLYFSEDDCRRWSSRFFDSLEFVEFSSAYYYATRVLYSSMCKEDGVEPDYEHQIHRLAVNLPCFGSYSPIRLVILHKPLRQ